MITKDIYIFTIKGRVVDAKAQDTEHRADIYIVNIDTPHGVELYTALVKHGAEDARHVVYDDGPASQFYIRRRFECPVKVHGNNQCQLCHDTGSFVR